MRRLAIIGWLSVGCTPPAERKAPCAEGYTATPSGCVPQEEEQDTGLVDDQDTATPSPLWQTLERSCEPPVDALDDPVVDLGELNTLMDGSGPGAFLMELVEVAVSDDGQRVLGVGQGGLMAFDVSDPDRPALVGGYPSDGRGRYHRVLLFSDSDPGRSLAYLTHRERGLSVVSIDDLESIGLVNETSVEGLGGMAQWEDFLYVSRHSGTVLIYDISDREHPVEVGEVDGLGHPWTLVATESALYVADATEGLVVLDRSDPIAPIVVEALDLGGVQDLSLGNGVIYAAAGSAGVVAVDISDPLQPVESKRVVFGTGAIGLARDGAELWVADQEGVRVLDVSSPLEPLASGSRQTAQWAMDVAALGGRAWVADWGRLGGYAADLEKKAPDLDISLSEVFLDASGDEVELVIRNLGQQTLQLHGALAEDDALQLQFSSDEVAAQDSAVVRIQWPGGALSDSLCLASNDPDQPQVIVDLHTGGGGAVGAVGGPAPDFILPDLSGDSHRLSEHLGSPVVLVYFATW